MPAFGSMLSGADITNLAKFLKGEAVAPPPPGSTPAPLPEMTPKELYISNCATCHGADRRGGRGPALLGKRVEKARDVARTMVRGEDGMPSFAGNDEHTVRHSLRPLTAWKRIRRDNMSRRSLLSEEL
jgi:mono/diheme cytochrome c family protein